MIEVISQLCAEVAMEDKTFWCAYELERFPIAELGVDAKGNHIHVTAGPCHYVNGNRCKEEPPPTVNVVPLDLDALYAKLPPENQ
jgi:hypothetical protein